MRVSGTALAYHKAPDASPGADLLPCCDPPPPSPHNTATFWLKLVWTLILEELQYLSNFRGFAWPSYSEELGALEKC